MKSPLNGRILIVDDDVANIEVISEVLGAGCEVFFATGGVQAMEIAKATAPDLVLLDVMMPGMDGYELCGRLRKDPTTAHIPVIFITGLGDLDAEVRALELGAVDYVTKPISPPVVRLRVRNQIELKRARQQLEKLADSDGLTGLANRRHFDVILDREVRRLARSGAPLSLIMMDVDYFKKYNDCYGHVAGDDCLRQVAEAVEANTHRAADIVARYGGEEFAVLLPETGHRGAVQLAERIREAILRARIPHDGSPVSDRVTSSFGVASVLCAPLYSPQDLVALADEHLYRAKSNGRNRVAAIDRTDLRSQNSRGFGNG
jgi:diguanylate cyclase (GGDEF)-like protein